MKILDFVEMNKCVGENGNIINQNMLESVLSSYFYYSDPVEQVASICRGLVKNHAFQDGNKRVAALFLLLMLKDYKNIDGYELEKLILDVIENKYEIKEIAKRIKELKNFSGIKTSFSKD